MSRCILFLLLMTPLMFKHPIQTFNLLSAALIPMQTCRNPCIFSISLPGLKSC
jgi:hypothetical protein